MTTRGGARIRAFRCLSRPDPGTVRGRGDAECTRVRRGAQVAADRGDPARRRSRRRGRAGDLERLPADAARRHLRRHDPAVPRATRGRSRSDCNTAETFPFSLNGNQQPGVTHKDGTGSVFIDIMTTARLPSLACSETHAVLAPALRDDGQRLRPERAARKNRVLVPLHFAQELRRLPAGAALRRADRDRGVGRARAVPVGRRTSAPARTRSRSTSRTRRRTRRARTSSPGEVDIGGHVAAARPPARSRRPRRRSR